MRKLLNSVKVGLFCSPLLLLFANFAVAARVAKAPRYVGYKKCRGCHKKEYNSWRKGPMSAAVAFRALMPNMSVEAKETAGIDPQKDYTDDPKCLECHVTGYGEPGGYVNALESEYLSGVTCEACHGPGSEYWKRMAKKRKTFTLTELRRLKFVLPSQRTCNKCHKPGCPTVDPDDASMDFDKSAAHDNFELKYEH